MLPIKICCLSSDATDGELEGTALRNLSPPAASAPKKFNSPSSRASTVCCCPQWRVRYRSALAIISALCKMANVKNSALGEKPRAAKSSRLMVRDGQCQCVNIANPSGPWASGADARSVHVKGITSAAILDDTSRAFGERV